MSEKIPQKEAAKRLGLSTRQIHNLVGEGMPKSGDGKRLEYPWPEILHWYIEHRIAAAQPTDLKDSQARKLAAEAMIAEIELQEKRRTVIPTEVHEQVHGEMADRLRAVLINIPSTYALDLERAGVPAEEAERILREIADRLIQALRGAVDEELDEAA